MKTFITFLLLINFISAESQTYRLLNKEWNIDTLYVFDSTYFFAPYGCELLKEAYPVLDSLATFLKTHDHLLVRMPCKETKSWHEEVENMFCNDSHYIRGQRQGALREYLLSIGVSRENNIQYFSCLLKECDDAMQLIIVGFHLYCINYTE